MAVLIRLDLTSQLIKTIFAKSSIGDQFGVGGFITIKLLWIKKTN